MNNSMRAVMKRRGELLATIASQRDEISDIAEQLKKPLVFVDQGWSVLRYLGSQPLLTAGLTILVVLNRRGLAGLLRTGWRVWRGYLYFNGLSAKFLSRP